MKRIQLGQLDPAWHHCDRCQLYGFRPHECSDNIVVRYCNTVLQVAHSTEQKLAYKDIDAACIQLFDEYLAIHIRSSHLVIVAGGPRTIVRQILIVAPTRGLRQPSPHRDSARMLDTFYCILRVLRNLRPSTWHWPSEYFFVRAIIPTMMLQLDEDQRAYDLAKLWSRYDFADITSPCAPLESSDIYENSAYLDENNGDINLVSTILLLKIKLLMDIRNVRIARQVVPPKLSAELVATIEHAVIQSSLSIQNLRLSKHDLHRREIVLNEHILQLGCGIHRASGYFWQAILDPNLSSIDPFEVFSPGSLTETSFMVQYNYAAWYQTEGVIQAMKRALAMSKDKSDMCAMWSNFKAALDF